MANDPKYRGVKDRLWQELKETLTAQGDPRMHGHGDCFDSCPVVFKGGRNWKTDEALLPDLPPAGEYNNKLETFQGLRKKSK